MTTSRLASIPILSVHTDRIPNLRYTQPGDSVEGNTRSPVEIAKSIAERGQDTPIDVTTNDGGITYDVIDGHTRTAAFRILAGLTLPDVPDPDWPKADPKRFAHIEARVFPPMTAAEVQYEALARGDVRNPYTTADKAYRIGEILRGPLRMSVQQLGRALGMNGSTINDMARVSGFGTYEGAPCVGLSPRVWDAWRRPRPGRPVGVNAMVKVATLPYGEQWEAWCRLMPEDVDLATPPPTTRRDMSRVQKGAASYARIISTLRQLGMLATDDLAALAEAGARMHNPKGANDRSEIVHVYRVALEAGGR